jgi:hypothetical protein
MTPKQEPHLIRNACKNAKNTIDSNDCPGFVFRQDGTNELSALLPRTGNITSISRKIKQEMSLWNKMQVIPEHEFTRVRFRKNKKQTIS